MSSNALFYFASPRGEKNFPQSLLSSSLTEQNKNFHQAEVFKFLCPERDSNSHGIAPEGF